MERGIRVASKVSHGRARLRDFKLSIQVVDKNDTKTRAAYVAEGDDEDTTMPITDTVPEPDFGQHTTTRLRFLAGPVSDINSIAERWEELAEMPATLLSRHEKEAMWRMDIPLINIFLEGNSAD